MKLTTASSLLALTLSATINTVTAIPQLPNSNYPTVQDTINRPTHPSTYRQPTNPSSSYGRTDPYYGRSNPSYNSNNDNDPHNPYDSYVSVTFTIPDGRTFTDDLALDESGYGSLPIYDRGYYSHILRADIVRSPARFPTNTCYLYVSGFERDGEEIKISRRLQYKKLPFDLEREYGMDDLYYVGAILYCASKR